MFRYLCPKCGQPLVTSIDPKYMSTPLCTNDKDDSQYRPFHKNQVKMELQDE